MKKNVHEIEIKLDVEWVKALDDAFLKQNKEVEIDGFRKGKAPKDVFLKKFGIESLYGNAVDSCIDIAYKRALKDGKLIPVCEPSVEVTGISDSNVIFKFTIITKPEVTLGEYKNLGVKREKAKVTEEEINDEIEHLKGHLADIVVKENGEIAEGDTAVIDYTGLIDGEEFKGGKGENYPLEIGSHIFIPGFEEGLVGLKTGEEKDLNLKFPENYTEELKGKDVVFKVKVNEIKTKVLPEVNKEFFEDLGYDEVNTEEEFRKMIEEELLEDKNYHLEEEFLNKVLDKAVSNMKVDINEEITHEEVNRMINHYAEDLKAQGMELEMFLQYTGMTKETLEKQLEPEALKRVEYRFLLESVAEKEDFKFSEEEIEAGAEELAKKYGVSKEELYQTFGSKEVVEYDMKMQKALEVIKENN